MGRVKNSAPDCLNSREHTGDCFGCLWFNACDNKNTDDDFMYNPLCLGKDLGLHDGSVCLHCARPSPEEMGDFKRGEDRWEMI